MTETWLRFLKKPQMPRAPYRETEYGEWGEWHRPTITRLVYPSKLFFDNPQDLANLNFQTYDIYPQNGWHFKEGTLTFPVKPCHFHDIKRIDVAFYAFQPSPFFINVNTRTGTVNYKTELKKPGAYQCSTVGNKFVYNEHFALLKKNGHSCSKVNNITINNPGNYFIISSIRITYIKYDINFQLMTF
jgi:hypothetical protein